MKILLCTSNFQPMHGGISVFLYNLCLELAGQGHELNVLFTGSKEEIRTPGEQDAGGFRTHRFILPSRMASFFIMDKIIRLQNRYKPDVMFLGHAVCSAAPGIWLEKNIFHVPSVILIHGAMLDWFLYVLGGMSRVWAKFALREASLVLANSSFTERMLIKEGVEPGRIGVLNPGVDVKLFRPGCNTNRIKEKYNLQDKRLILSAGRLMKRKNFISVIRALPKVLKQFPEVVYMMIGSGPEENNLRQEAGRLGMERTVIFAGEVDNIDMPSYYCASEVFVMPSLALPGDNETFGMVYLEANSCGIPVIAGNTGGIADAVADGVSGSLLDPGNPEVIADAIIKILGDGKYAKEMGRKGRLRAEETFTWEKIGKMLEDYLERAVRIKR